MPTFKCSVCGVSASSVAKFSFFALPSDNRREIWLEFIRKTKKDGNWIPIKSSRICCQHFSSDSFEHRPLVSLENFCWKKVLVKTANPTIDFIAETKECLSADMALKNYYDEQKLQYEPAAKRVRVATDEEMSAAAALLSLPACDGTQLPIEEVPGPFAKCLRVVTNEEMSAAAALLSLPACDGPQLPIEVPGPFAECLRVVANEEMSAAAALLSLPTCDGPQLPIEVPGPFAKCLRVVANEEMSTASGLVSLPACDGPQLPIEVLEPFAMRLRVATDVETSAAALKTGDGLTACQRYELCALKSELARNLVEQERLKEQMWSNVEVGKKQAKALQKDHDRDMKKLKDDMQRTKLKLEKERQKNQKLMNDQKVCDAQAKKCRRELRKLQKQLTKEKRQSSNILPEVKKLLGTCLTSNQIDAIVLKKKRTRWTKEELSTAFTIRYFGINAYDFLRKNLHYPLPCLSTLRRYASKLNLKEGHLMDVIKMLKLAASQKTERERVTVLSFDEMAVKSVYELDSADDEIIGPHKYLQVVMARGLFSKWKTPVYVGFDTNMTKELLNQIVSNLHNASYSVVSCVSDMGSSNLGLWKELDVSFLKPYFLHPVTSEKITMFADVPHLLKLTRNWLLQSGFILKNGVHITKRPLQMLLEIAAKEDAEFNSLFHITSAHLNVNFSEKMNVRLAAQTLSRSVAVALKRYLPNDNEAIHLSNFISDINDWFDVLNSHHTTRKEALKKPFDYSYNQLRVLNSVRETMLTMRRPDKPSIQIFQKGILQSIASIKMLFCEMRRRYGIQYILTYKVNQDVLENHFGRIRCWGGTEHPSPIESLRRMKLIMLGKTPDVATTAHTNTIDQQNDEEYVPTVVFERAGVKTTTEDISMVEPTRDLQPFDVPERLSELPHTSSMHDVEDDGLEYALGFMVRKLGSNPELGHYSYKTQTDHDYSSARYVHELSFGGLTEPTDYMLIEGRKMNDEIKKLHHSGHFAFKQNIVRRTAAYLRQFTTLSKEVVTVFVQLFVKFRIKRLNREMRELAKKKVLKSKAQKKLLKLKT